MPGLILANSISHLGIHDSHTHSCSSFASCWEHLCDLLATCLKWDLCRSKSVFKCCQNPHSPLASCRLYLCCFAFIFPPLPSAHISWPASPQLHFQYLTLEPMHIFLHLAGHYSLLILRVDVNGAAHLQKTVKATWEKQE